MRWAKNPYLQRETDTLSLLPPRAVKPVRGSTKARKSPPVGSPPAKAKSSRAPSRRRTSFASHPPPRSDAAPTSSRRPTVRPVAKAPKPTHPTLSPEEHLARAMDAQTARSRAVWARRGLASHARLDKTTQSMLLRQLYLAHFEQRHFEDAFAVAQQSLELGVLLDVVHQDAARACVALGDLDAAAGHLRLAARIGPPNRRAFHWWTLGSMYYVGRRYAEAIAALARAARWGTRDKPLYQGHLAAARCASGLEVTDLADLIENLARVPAGQGYGRFVLGQMAFYGGRSREARTYLEAFIDRTAHGRPALAIALDGELERARNTLDDLAEAAE